jgi:hypothetical protein
MHGENLCKCGEDVGNYLKNGKNVGRVERNSF